MSVSQNLLFCELCLLNRIQVAPLKVSRFAYCFHNFLQQIFENFKIDVPVNEIQNRICEECGAKILNMCEDLESWREAQSKRPMLPLQDHETVVVKMEPPETKSETESEQDLTSFDEIELSAVKLELNADKQENNNTENEGLLIVPDYSSVNSHTLNNESHGIHRLDSKVIHNIRRYNCNHTGCTASFTYKRSYETHIQKCHLTHEICSKLNKTCTAHVRSISGKNLYRRTRSIQDYHYNDCGQGHFIPVKDKAIQRNRDAPKKKQRQKREIKLCHYDGKGLGRFIKLNITKTLQ